MSECQKKRNAKEWNSILIVTLTASVENPELLPGSGIIGSGSVKNKRADKFEFISYFSGTVDSGL